MPDNVAAWLTASKARPMEVKSAPYTRPRDDEIVIKSGAVAINPLEVTKQEMGEFLYGWTKYPMVMGSDVAGEVVEIGSAVTRFKVGDRVVGHALGLEEKRNTAAEGSFQKYVVVLEKMASPIPVTMPYENATVLPLGLSTAACGLFQKDHLALPYPSVKPKSSGQTLIIWGGSTSVGCNAIQLTRAAGYEVIATASPKNSDYLKKLGASQVFDYNSKAIVQDLLHACRGKTLAGALICGNGGMEVCFEVLSKCKGNKFLSTISFPLPQPKPKRFVVFRTVVFYMGSMAKIYYKSWRTGVRWKFVWGSDLAWNEVGKAIYEDFLPQALADGSFVPAPEPLVIGKGLEHIQAALDRHNQGVSAKKVVVSL